MFQNSTKNSMDTIPYVSGMCCIKNCKNKAEIQLPDENICKEHYKEYFEYPTDCLDFGDFPEEFCCGVKMEFVEYDGEPGSSNIGYFQCHVCGESKDADF